MPRDEPYARRRTFDPHYRFTVYADDILFHGMPCQCCIARFHQRCAAPAYLRNNEYAYLDDDMYRPHHPPVPEPAYYAWMRNPRAPFVAVAASTALNIALLIAAISFAVRPLSAVV